MNSSSSNEAAALQPPARRPRGRPRKYVRPDELQNSPSSKSVPPQPRQREEEREPRLIKKTPSNKVVNNSNSERHVAAGGGLDNGNRNANKRNNNSNGSSTDNDNNEESGNDDVAMNDVDDETEFRNRGSKLPPTGDDMRVRRERKLYSDEWALGGDDDDADEGGLHVFNIYEKLESSRFEQNFVMEMKGSDFNLSFLQKNGFVNPILFKDQHGLGMQVPSSSFSVRDVRACVGSRRVIEVMDVPTQKNIEMTMRDFQRYYDNPYKTKLLNVISLEFSHTRLENYVITPSIVRQIDWVDCVWPRQLKDAQTDSTNNITEMKYPKVQKYCLMSTKGCYTDFHIDFGGTSVWYHILRGRKVFWLIPPTERNLKLYEQWILSGKQNDVFFGDTVEKCGRVHLFGGDTFFIPTGWIHAVYTVKDSLVFGGNFLHSFGIEKQLRIAEVEDATHVPQKYRYPYFTEMLWFVLERYVYSLLGISHLKTDLPVKESPEESATERNKDYFNLTNLELHGLKAIIKYVHTLPANKKNVPLLITDPVKLVRNVRTLVEIHCHDNPELAITGRLALLPQENSVKKVYKNDDKEVKVKMPKIRSASNTPRRRRTRCKKCQACRQPDCGECAFCLDMVKFGGPGRAKQTCVARQCLQPMLPITAACMICGLDGWGQQIVIPIQKVVKETPSTLMECSICYEIAHPACLGRQIENADGAVNEDLPNSWECPKCCKDGRNLEHKPRHFRARQKCSDIRRNSVSSDTSSNKRMLDDSEQSDAESTCSKPPSEINAKPSIMMTPKKRKYEEPIENGNNSPPPPPLESRSPVQISESLTELPDIKPDIGAVAAVSVISNNDNLGNHSASTPLQPVKIEPSEQNARNCQNSSPNLINLSAELGTKKVPLRTQLAHQMTQNSHKPLKRPIYPVRPAPIVNKVSSTENSSMPPYMTKLALLLVFKQLSTQDLLRCSLVCKAWADVSLDSSLWKKIDITGKKLGASCLSAVVRRQPDILIVDWTAIAKRQLEWLMSRLPQLKELSLQGCTWQGVSALRMCNCPPLISLDVSFVTNMNDMAVRDILLPPKDTRPGLVDSKSRLRNLRTLKLAGCDISDVSIRYIVQNVPLLTTLDLSQCFRISDAGIAQLIAPPATTTTTLVSLDLSGCSIITDTAVDHLIKCTSLKYLDLRHTPLISDDAIRKFVELRPDLSIIEEKLLVKICKQTVDD